ncbi:MAG: hypothetical protein LQ343_004082 [Gyalolechia ehrenbergii]|nr:MAG: hypothetical protein LQ343_004082 [Gyalolechia ehrenbergii]
MEPQVLYRVCYGSATPTSFQKSLLGIRPAVLHRHCRHRVLGRDYPAIIPSPSDSVRGTYVHGLTDGDIFRLDIFEGNEYERRKVTIRILEVEGDENGIGNLEGGEVEVDTYIWIAGEDELEKGEWDFGEFRREKMQRWIASSDQYNDVDEAVEARGGDPTGGRGANGNITGQLNREQEKKVMGSAV